MASVDCRLIAPQSPFRTLIVEPVQEGVYATRQGSQLLYGIFQKCVLSRTFPDPQGLAQGLVYLVTGFSLLIPLVNTIVFQIFVSVSGSYREALRVAVDRGDVETVKHYLSLGVSPNNLYDTIALLFRSTKREIIEALVESGADLNRTCHGMSFLEHLVNNHMEDLAVKYFDQSCLDGKVYQEAINKKNWPFAAFLIRMGESSQVGRDRIVIDPETETKNSLELPVIQGNA